MNARVLTSLCIIAAVIFAGCTTLAEGEVPQGMKMVSPPSLTGGKQVAKQQCDGGVSRSEFSQNHMHGSGHMVIHTAVVQKGDVPIAFTRTVTTYAQGRAAGKPSVINAARLLSGEWVELHSALAVNKGFADDWAKSHGLTMSQITGAKNCPES